MSVPQKSNWTKRILIVAVLLAVVVIVGVMLMFGRRAPDGTRVAVDQALGPLSGPAPGVPDDAALRRLMSQAGADPAAAFPGHAQVRVVSETATSVQLALTFPDNETAEETIAIQPGRRYKARPAELEAAARAGRQTFDVKFSSAPDGAGATRITLEYFVPYSAFPADLRQRIEGKPSTAWHFELVSSAWAQDDGGLGELGAGVSSGFKLGKGLAKGYKSIDSALDKSQQHADWMQRLDALENCARNPTSALTRNAYRQDPNYQQQALDAIQQARSEVQQATAVRFLNQETSLAYGLAGGPLKQLTGPVTNWNDSTLKSVADQQVSDVGKLVNCNLVPPPPVPELADGTIMYHMHREHYLDFDEEDRLVKSTFNLQPGPVAGYVALAGQGAFKGRASSSRYGTKTECGGTSKVHGGGYSGDFLVSGGPVGGKCTFDDRGKVTELSPADSDTGFVCRFQNLDLVNGGSYEVQADGEESAFATCKLELKPQRK